MSDIKVTVITVCFNSAGTIRRCIESVLNQTYKNLEYIIVDGKSTDNTVDIIKEYEPEFGGRLRWVSEPDGGIYDAMNKGIAMATGDLIGILNSDDAYEPGAAALMAERTRKDAYQILYGMVKFYRNDIFSRMSIISHESLPQTMINHPACFVTANVYKDFGVFDTQYVAVADFDFMIRMKTNSEVEFEPVFEHITNFYEGGMSASHRAYMDLMKLKKNYGMISSTTYKKHQLIYKLMKIKRKLTGQKL